MVDPAKWPIKLGPPEFDAMMELIVRPDPRLNVKKSASCPLVDPVLPLLPIVPKISFRPKLRVSEVGEVPTPLKSPSTASSWMV